MRDLIIASVLGCVVALTIMLYKHINDSTAHAPETQTTKLSIINTPR